MATEPRVRKSAEERREEILAVGGREDAAGGERERLGEAAGPGDR